MNFADRMRSLKRMLSWCEDIYFREVFEARKDRGAEGFIQKYTKMVGDSLLQLGLMETDDDSRLLVVVDDFLTRLEKKYPELFTELKEKIGIPDLRRYFMQYQWDPS